MRYISNVTLLNCLHFTPCAENVYEDAVLYIHEIILYKPDGILPIIGKASGYLGVAGWK
jgi:hypothetical protein